MIKLKAKDVMLKEVVTIKPTDIVAFAKLVMTRQGIGGLPVVEEDELKGIITHRDIILVGNDAMNLRVEEIMARKIMTVEEDTPLKEVMKLMVETGYQRIPVVRGKKMVGLITQSSIISSLTDLI
jgi:CBS domain-containing protein